MTEQEQLNIYQKLAKIRKQVEVIRKNKSGYGYKYVSEDEILAKITIFMDKYGLSLIPSIVVGSIRVEPHSYSKTKTTKGGEFYEESVNEILVTADMTYSWINNDNPEERVEVEWAMVGYQSDGSQSFGSGLTYSFRYFLLKYFNIATPDDDPDNFRLKQKEAEAAEEKIITNAIIQTIDAHIKQYLEAHNDKRDNVMALVKKYVKSGDYFLIKDSSLATKLLDDLLNLHSSKDELSTRDVLNNSKPRKST